MRAIEKTTAFKRDYKRELTGPRKVVLIDEFVMILTALANDKPLDVRYRDHSLTGEWKDHRDCHLKPDLVLIYRKPDKHRLQLVRLGSHSQLSL